MSFSALLDSFKGMPALVIGDLMLDEYHFGHATRISPEAPVMVIRHSRSAQLPGGAANVALNLKALGAKPTLIGVAGEDAAGDQLEDCLEVWELEGYQLIREPNRQTTKKTRIVANHAHQVLRLDFEASGQIDPKTEDALLDAVRTQVKSSAVVLISDYLKGTCTNKLCDWTIRWAKEGGVPVVVNPKPSSLQFYRGASLVSFNQAEAMEAALVYGSTDQNSIRDAMEFLDEQGFGSALVTMGEAGMVAYGAETFDIPAPKVEVYDTAGAGDTVIATVALGMASVGFKKEIFELAAQTAACVVRHVGVATPSKEDLAAIRAMK